MKKLFLILIASILCSCASHQKLERTAGLPAIPPPRNCTDAEIAAGTSTTPCTPTPKIIADNYGGAAVEVEDDVYGAGWNGDANHSPSQNAAYDIISTLQVKPAEGAFADGDKTKLDGIETAADVTDATNVEAAGAVMDADIGVTVQAYDADLLTFAGITPSANVQSYLGAANYAAMRSLLSLGTVYQYDVGTGANNIVQLDGTGALPAVDGSNLTGLPGGGDVTGVLGDSTGDVPLLFQDASTFTLADATPDVSTATHWITADTTTYDDFDGTPVDGQQLWIYCAHAATFDLTASGIEAWNRTTDLTVTVGYVALLIFEDSDNQWHFVNAPDATAQIGSNGFIARTGAGTAAARTFQDSTGGELNATNGDGVSGNPQYDIDVAPSSGSATLEIAEDALQIKYNAADFDEGANGLYFDYTNGQKASDTQPGLLTEIATTAETSTGTDTARAVSPDGLSGSVYGQKEIGWTIHDSDDATAVADGKQAAVIPASMTGMNLVDLTCSVANLNSASGGATTVVLRRVRAGTPVDMTSTGVTIAYDEYTASDETVDATNDDVSTGDNIYVDINAVTTGAVQLGLSCTAVFQTP